MAYRGGRLLPDLNQTFSAINALPLQDRLRLIQAVWDSLPSDEELPVSAEQQVELDRRLAAHEADPLTSLTHGEFLRRLREDV